MKRLLLALAFCLTATNLSARGILQGYVHRGGQTVTTNGVVSSTKVQASYPLATVTVYKSGTSTLATLYSDSVGNTKVNPFTASSLGYWFFYADDGDYDVTFSGGGISTSYTWPAMRIASSSSATSYVDVASYATAGAGTSASPWTGWDTAITWTSEIEYRFRSGWYQLASSPAGWSQGRMRLIGSGGTFLKYTNTGNAFTIGDPTNGGANIFELQVRGFVIVGNSSTTNGFTIYGVHYSHFSDIRVMNCTAAAFRVIFGVGNQYDKLTFTGNATTSATGGSQIVNVPVTAFGGTTLTSVGTTATATTLSAHGYRTGDVITVSGANQTAYNGQYTITVTSATTFTYTFAGAASPATGSITVSATPANAFYVTSRLPNSGSEFSTASQFNNCVGTNVFGDAWVVDQAFTITLEACIGETAGGKGFNLTAWSATITLINCHSEGNTGDAFYTNGQMNTFVGCFSPAGIVRFDTASNTGAVFGGGFRQIIIAAGAKSIAVYGATYNYDNSGLSISDSGANTTLVGNRDFRSTTTVPDKFGNGAWTTFTPTFTADVGIVTVNANTTARYMVINKMMTVLVQQTVTLSSTPTTITMPIPGGYTSANTLGSTWPMYLNGTAAGTGFVGVNAGLSTISIRKDVSGTAFAATASDIIQFSFSFEVQ